VLEAIIASIDGADLAALAQNSPAYADQSWQWQTYLRCSVARMVHAAAALRQRGVTGGRLLDVGAYFGNFSLLFAQLGFDVDAVDAFRQYTPALDGPNAVLRRAGVRLLDFEDTGRELERLEPGSYDVVLCTGVIEHIPHTPRFLLEGLDRVLKMGGQLLLDTPNLTHIYNRQKFARGNSVQAELPAQYYADRPFEGHHREYTISELAWMLAQVGHRDLRIEAFNYSAYAQPTLLGRDVTNHWAMVQDPTMREYLLTVSTKPADRGPLPPRVEDVAWQATVVDPERYWQQALPADLPAPTVSAEGEQMLTVLQREIDLRDALLADAQAALRAQADRQLSAEAEVARRDQLIRDAELSSQREIQLRDEKLSNQEATLQAEIQLRDQMLTTQEANLQAEIQLRDQLLIAQKAHLQAEIQLRDQLLADLRAKPPKRRLF